MRQVHTVRKVEVRNKLVLEAYTALNSLHKTLRLLAPPASPKKKRR